MAKHLQRAIAKLPRKGNWPTKKTELILLNNEDLYNIANKLIQQSNSWSELSLKLEVEIAPLLYDMEYFENEEVENIDWHTLAGTLFEW